MAFEIEICNLNLNQTLKCKSEFIMELQSCKRNIENWNLKLKFYGIVIWYIDLWEVKIHQSYTDSQGVNIFPVSIRQEDISSLFPIYQVIE